MGNKPNVFDQFYQAPLWGGYWPFDRLTAGSGGASFAVPAGAQAGQYGSDQSPQMRKEPYRPSPGRDVKEEMTKEPGVVDVESLTSPGARAIWQEKLSLPELRDVIQQHYPHLSPLIDAWLREAFEMDKARGLREGLSPEAAAKAAQDNWLRESKRHDDPEWGYSMDPSSDVVPPDWDRRRSQRFFDMGKTLRRLMERDPSDVTGRGRRGIDDLLRGNPLPRGYDPGRSNKPIPQRGMPPPEDPANANEGKPTSSLGDQRFAAAHGPLDRLMWWGGY